MNQQLTTTAVDQQLFDREPIVRNAVSLMDYGTTTEEKGDKNEEGLLRKMNNEDWSLNELWIEIQTSKHMGTNEQARRALHNGKQDRRKSFSWSFGRKRRQDDDHYHCGDQHNNSWRVSVTNIDWSQSYVAPVHNVGDGAQR